MNYTEWRHKLADMLDSPNKIDNLYTQVIAPFEEEIKQLKRENTRLYSALASSTECFLIAQGKHGKENVPATMQRFIEGSSDV